jgi:hypothetical protein
MIAIKPTESEIKIQTDPLPAPDGAWKWFLIVLQIGRADGAIDEKDEHMAAAV